MQSNPVQRVVSFTRNACAPSVEPDHSLLKVFISGMRSVPNGNDGRNGMHTESLLITTPGRELRLTAGSQEQHATWTNVSGGSTMSQTN
jgi:hypothetical protein